MAQINMDKFSKIKKYGLIFWISGFLAFVWVVLRSGLNPKRLTYPCQQVAFPLASAWVIAVLSLWGGFIITKHIRKVSTISLLILIAGIFMVSSSTSLRPNAEVDVNLPAWQVSNPVSEVFVMNNIPNTVGSLAAGDASVPNTSFVDPAMDTLFQIMDAEGHYFYNTSSHPNGIVESDDIVVIKGNFQWDSRLGTHTDRIKGLIWKILNHPDGFSGEILVCDNTQEYSVIDDNKNNSEDTEQSIIDVVNTFNAKGYPVYLMNWVDLREITVSEFSFGDTTNGYVYEADTKISYPKFITPGGTKVSLRYGIYQISDTWDKSKLCIINFPVIKAHCMMGATLGLKNWVGLLTTGNTDTRYGSWDDMHYTYFWGEYALLSRVMEVTFPDLTILDGTWTNGYSNWEFDENYNFHTRCLVASTDPLASSWYAAKYILNPIAFNKTNTDPDNSNGEYGSAIKKLAGYLIDSAHIDITMDPNKISVYDRTSLTGETKIVGKLDVNTIKIYPNPTIDGISIIMPDIPVEHIEIVDSKGTVYMPSFKKTGTKIDVHLNGLTIGSYYVIIRSQNREISRPFIKH
ncbi:MAG: DUF362 domain-containing protein [Bacteroidales bacterium]|nr:DUF362 domain-containing protein [Bacteroidales bacterium]